MKKIIIMPIVLIFLVGISLAAGEQVYHYRLDLSYNNGRITLTDVLMKPGFITTQTGDYKVELLSLKDAKLYSANFTVPINVYGDVIDPETGDFKGTVIELEHVNFTLTVPYSEDGNKINIYDSSGKKILETDVSKFDDVCPNGICKIFENCPQDCGNVNYKNLVLIGGSILLVILASVGIWFVYRGIKKSRKVTKKDNFEKLYEKYGKKRVKK
jgi:hypothetical protein